MLRSYDAKQCSFRNHKAESITGVEKTEEGGTETESSSASEANKNAGKAQVIGDAVYSKVMDGLLNPN